MNMHAACTEKWQNFVHEICQRFCELPNIKLVHLHFRSAWIHRNGYVTEFHLCKQYIYTWCSNFKHLQFLLETTRKYAYYTLPNYSASHSVCTLQYNIVIMHAWDCMVCDIIQVHACIIIFDYICVLQMMSNYKWIHEVFYLIYYIYTVHYATCMHHPI